MRNRLLKVLLLLTITGFLLSCRNARKGELDRLQQQLEDLSIERAENVTVQYNDSAKLKAIINTPLLIRFPQKKEPYTEMPKGLNATFFNTEGKEDSKISAAYGINYEIQKLIKLKDSVRVYNQQGEELKCEELYWNQKTKKIYTQTFVKIVRDGETLRGKGFESNETFTKWRILKPAGSVSVTESPLQEIE
ncbi:MAG: LPS export ABC transporter periplasmic protein LptC [Flavobacteriales bacterium]|nr:LPS export ABC transporter periplasmic protein LptC [Flavobacteriales bacterium]